MVLGGENATVELVAVEVGGQRWALPLHAVERALPMVEISPLPGAPTGVRGAINVHGEPVPVLDLDVRLGRAPRERGTRAKLLIARTATRRGRAAGRRGPRRGRGRALRDRSAA